MGFDQLTIHDIRELKRQLISSDVKSISGQYCMVDHPRSVARIYWYGGRYLKAIYTWIRTCYQLKLDTIEQLRDMPWE